MSDTCRRCSNRFFNDEEEQDWCAIGDHPCEYDNPLPCPAFFPIKGITHHIKKERVPP